MKTLEIAFQNQGLQVRRLSRITKSLRESPFDNPYLTFRALLDEFVIKSPGFSSPISVLRKTSRSLLENHGDFECAILAWLPGLLTAEDYKTLSGTPTIIRVPDENPYTAVCHYTNGCTGYLSGCTKCPAVRGSVSSKVRIELARKIDSYRTLQRKAFVCPSNWVAARAEKSFALKNEDISVIRNPIDESFFFEPKVSSRSKKLTVLFVASQVFDPVKGFNSIAARLDKLSDAKEFQVRVVGHPGRQADRFPSIKFLGRLNAQALAEEYKKAWVTVVPSRSEASGNVVGESLASGTPTLVRNVGGLGEVAGQVSRDLLFDTDEELLDKLSSLNFKNFHGRREDLISVAQQHHPKIIAEQYLQLLKSL